MFKNEWTSFLMFWILWTPLFFTLSKSLIHPYIMPVMVPLALLMTHWFGSFKRKVLLIKIGLIIPVASVVLVISGISMGYIESILPTDKYLIEKYVRMGETIYYLNSKKYSSQFYSKGNIRNITMHYLEDSLSYEEDTFKIIVKNSEFEKVSPHIQGQLQLLGKSKRKSIYVYFKP